MIDLLCLPLGGEVDGLVMVGYYSALIVAYRDVSPLFMAWGIRKHGLQQRPPAEVSLAGTIYVLLGQL